MKTSIVMVALMLLAAGCTDKARPYLDTCLDYERQGELQKAHDACTNGIEADPTSSSGTSAKEKLREIEKAIMKRCSDRLVVGNLDGAQEACAQAFRFGAPIHDQAVAAIDEINQKRAAAAQDAVVKAEASCTGHWLTICDIGPNGSGQQLFPTLAACQQVVTEQRELTHVACDACRCVH